MSIKLTGNGLWESSRMMLPEHKERIILHNDELLIKKRKELDEQEKEQISIALHRSKTNEEAVTISLFGEYKDEEYRGVVDSVDQLHAKVRVSGRWIHLQDILSAIED